MDSNDFREQFMMAAVIADNVNGVSPDIRKYTIFEPLMIQNLVNWAIPTHEDQAEFSYFFKLSYLIGLLEYNLLRVKKANQKQPPIVLSTFIVHETDIPYLASEAITRLSQLVLKRRTNDTESQIQTSFEVTCLIDILCNQVAGYKAVLKARIMLTAYDCAKAAFPTAMAGYDKMSSVEVLAKMWHELEVMTLDNDVTNNITQATNDLLYKLGLTEQKNMD